MARIKDLEESTAASISDNDLLVISDSTDNHKEKKLKFSSLVTKLFGGKIPGGAQGTDITQNNATQELTNKKLLSPKINSNDSLLATSAELNKLHDLLVTKAELSCLMGITGNLQERLSETVSEATLLNIPKFATITKQSDGKGELRMNSSLIKAALGLPASYEIKANVILEFYYPEPDNMQRLNPDIIILWDGNVLEEIIAKTLPPSVNILVSIVCTVVKN